MTRNLLLCLLAPLLALASCNQPNATGKPNVVVILADDLGFDDVDWHGGKVVTPNIHSIAKDGVELTRCYAFPICSPSRASLLTGRSALRHGLSFAAIRPDSKDGLPLDEVTMADFYREHGYATAIIGKWHLGHTDRAQHPNERGFDHFYGHLTGAIDYFDHTREGGIDWQRNGKSVKEEGYATDLLGAEAAQWIRKQDTSQPFFLYLPFNAPHFPNQAPDDLLERYADFGTDTTGAHYAMIDSLDLAIGEILRAIDETDRRENTIVVFLSDNGGNQKYGGSNEPFRGSKRHVTEGGVHVVGAVRWPARLPKGELCGQFTSVMDLLPTLAEATDLPTSSLPPLDGKSRLAGWEGTTLDPPDGVIFGTERIGQIAFALFQDEWKLIRRYQIPEVLDAGLDLASAETTNELYRIISDPTETTDVAAENPEVVAALARRIEEWIAVLPPDYTRKGRDLDPDWKAPLDWAASLH